MATESSLFWNRLRGKWNLFCLYFKNIIWTVPFKSCRRKFWQKSKGKKHEQVLLPPANEVRGKLMFLHRLSVSHSVHGGRMSASGSSGVVSASGSGGCAHTHGHTPPRQQAGGTRPTGMLSCLPLLLSQNEFYFLQLEMKQTTYSKSSRPYSVKI